MKMWDVPVHTLQHHAGLLVWGLRLRVHFLLCRSRGPPPSSYQQATLPGSVAAPHRVAWSPDLGGITPVDAAVAAVCADAVQWFNTELGAEVVQAQPDLAHAAEMFRVGDTGTAAHDTSMLVRGFM